MKSFLKSTSLLAFVALLASCSSADNSLSQQQEQEVTVNRANVEQSAIEPKNNFPKEEAIKIAMQQFDAYLPKILESHDAAIDLQEPFSGDFTGDGIDDVAIYFSLSPKGGGNALVGQGITLYQNTGNAVKVIAGYEPDYLFSFDTIKNGKVYVKKLEYAENDGRCCPSIQTEHTLTISGGKAF